MDTSLRDISRQAEKLEMMAKLGVNSQDRGAFAIAVTTEEVRAALQSIKIPEQRLLHEFFWFWPTTGDSKTDEALSAIKRGDVQHAEEVWTAAGVAQRELTSIAVVVVIILVIIGNSDNDSSSHAPSSSQTSPVNSSDTQADTPASPSTYAAPASANDTQDLRASIEQNQTRLRQMESELSNWNAQIDNLKSEIETDKASLTTDGKRPRSGSSG